MHNLEKGGLGGNYNQDYEIPAMINSSRNERSLMDAGDLTIITFAGDYTPWSALTQQRTSYSHPQPGPASPLKLKT